MADFRIVDSLETPYLYVERSCSMDPQEISKTMGTAFYHVWGYMEKNAIKPSGPAIAVYYTFDPETINFRAGFVVSADLTLANDNVVKMDRTPAGRAVHFVHKGAYATLRDDYALMMQYLKDEKLEMGSPTWELYMNDPETTPEDELLTECYMALS